MYKSPSFTLTEQDIQEYLYNDQILEPEYDFQTIFLLPGVENLQYKTAHELSSEYKNNVEKINKYTGKIKKLSIDPLIFQQEIRSE